MEKEPTYIILAMIGIVVFLQLTVVTPFRDKPTDNTQIGVAQANIKELIRDYERDLRKANEPKHRRSLREKLVPLHKNLVELGTTRKKAKFEIPVIGIEVSKGQVVIFYPLLIFVMLVYVSYSRESWLKNNNSVSTKRMPFWAYPTLSGGEDIQMFNRIIANSLAIFLHALPIIWASDFLLDVTIRQEYLPFICIFALLLAIQYFRWLARTISRIFRENNHV